MVNAGPLRAEISFYEDGSENSIFINDEDTLKCQLAGDGALSTGWTKTGNYVSQSQPLKITPPTDQVIRSEDWRREIAKVYYENIEYK